MALNIYLSDDENKALVLIAEGKTTNTIREKCVVPLSGMAFFLSEIRRKTGIRDTKFSKEAKDYLTKFAAIVPQSETKEQRLALRFYMAGETMEAIVRKLKLSPSDFSPFMDAALHSIGIFTRDERARRMQIRQYLTSFYPNETVSFTPDRLAVLRGIAEGKPFPQIADELGKPFEWVQFAARDMTKSLGLAARGRDVIRTLVSTFLKVRDARNPAVTMDDPAF